MSIDEWPMLDRPREKLIRFGAPALSDTELLAIFLRSGVRGSSALDLARGLLNNFGTLSRLMNTPYLELTTCPGVGKAKYAQLMASRELVYRALAEEMQSGDVLHNPQAVRDYLRLVIGYQDVEIVIALFLSAQNMVLAVEKLFRGTLTEARVYPREVARLALHHNASGVIIAHNHPSGQAVPSDADIRLTGILKNALSLIDILLLDHFIVTQHQCMSLAEAGCL